MSIGQVYRAYRKETGMTQEEFTQHVPLDRTTLAKIEGGKRRAPKDIMRIASQAFDDPRLSMAAQEEVSGGASVPWLTNADLHPSTVHLKTQEEVEEALAASHTVPITKRKDQLTEADREIIKVAIMEVIEAITALMHYAAILCREYKFSWMSLWKSHRAELRAKKYIN